MKFAAAFALILFLGGGVVLIRQHQRAAAEAMRAESATSQVKVESPADAAQREREKPDPKESPVSAAAVVTHGESTTLPATNSSPGHLLLNDPETRALMHKQQEQGLRKAVDQLLSKNFIQELNLSPEQAEKVKALLRDKHGAGADISTAMLFDGLDDDALAQRGRDTKQKMDQVNTALRELLGQEGFDALNEREQSADDRTRVRHLREELASAGGALSKEQEKSLLAAMSSERQAFPFRVDFRDPATYDYEHIRDFFSEANLQSYYEDMQQLNSRIIDRAALFLDPAQVEQLKTVQNNQLEKGRLTVKMTTELFNKRRSN